MENSQPIQHQSKRYNQTKQSKQRHPCNRTNPINTQKIIHQTVNYFNEFLYKHQTEEYKNNDSYTYQNSFVHTKEQHKTHPSSEHKTIKHS
jgi:hypothetical protein